MEHREPIPDAENGALIVAQALSHIPLSWPPATPAPPGEPKPPPSPVLQAYERIGDTPKNVRLDNETATVLRDDLNFHQAAVELARSVKNYARGRTEVVISPNPIETPLPHVQDARHLARLLVADSAVLAHDGDFDAALESCRSGIGVARSIGDEPFVISHLVRIAIVGVSVDAACRVLAQGEPSDAALARLQADLLTERDQPILLYGMRGERASMTEIIRKLANEEMPISALSSGGQPFDPTAPVPRIAPWGKLTFENQEAIELEWMNQAVSISRRPVFEQPPLWKDWEAEIERVHRLWYAPYTATLPLLLTPGLSAFATANLRYQTTLGAMSILLAAERHRQKTGQWPRSVAEIDKAILPEPTPRPLLRQTLSHRLSEQSVLRPLHRSQSPRRARRLQRPPLAPGDRRRRHRRPRLGRLSSWGKTGRISRLPPGPAHTKPLLR